MSDATVITANLAAICRCALVAIAPKQFKTYETGALFAVWIALSLSYNENDLVWAIATAATTLVEFMVPVFLLPGTLLATGIVLATDASLFGPRHIVALCISVASLADPQVRHLKFRRPSALWRQAKGLWKTKG